jgi:hypothetical protein
MLCRICPRIWVNFGDLHGISVIVQLLKTEITLRFATADRFREVETERVHHATRPHAQR